MSEVAIVGGGLAGAAAATLLAKDGRRVTLYEREAEPRHKVCGEFLSIGAQRRLRASGLDPATLGGARIDAFRLVAGARTVEARLPFTALGIMRRRLDAALLDHAAAAGARVLRDVAVRSADGRRLRTSLGDVDAPTLLLASGKHELRGMARRTGGCDTGYVGFKTYFRLAPDARAALAGRVDVVLFRDGYAGLQPVEYGAANLCLVVRRERLAELGGWDALLADLRGEPHLGRYLADAEPLLAKPLTVAGVPYGFRHRPDPGDVAYRLGDQAAVIPSFCGDGMAMALETAFVCARAVADGQPVDSYHRLLRARFAGQMCAAMALQRIGAMAALRGPLLGLLAIAPSVATVLVGLTRVRERAGAEPL